MSRVDESGAAFAGSQLQTQLYVNRRVSELNEVIREAVPRLTKTRIEWRSPLASARYAEYSDAAFLQAVDLHVYSEALNRFWPKGGPHWDALATVETDESSRPEVILVEAKSYPKELYGPGCAATPKSRALIEQSLAWTRQRLGVDESHSDFWTGPLYQSANRLAHLCWLASVGVRAWLIYLLFTDDPHVPTTAEQWRTAIQESDEALGISGIRLDHMSHVLLKAGPRSELAPEQ